MLASRFPQQRNSNHATIPHSPHLVRPQPTSDHHHAQAYALCYPLPSSPRATSLYTSHPSLSEQAGCPQAGYLRLDLQDGCRCPAPYHKLRVQRWISHVVPRHRRAYYWLSHRTSSQGTLRDQQYRVQPSNELSISDLRRVLKYHRL